MSKQQLMFENEYSQLTTAQRCLRKKIEDLFNSVLSQFQKYNLAGNQKFNYLGIFQSLKLRISLEKNPFSTS